MHKIFSLKNDQKGKSILSIYIAADITNPYTSEKNSKYKVRKMTVMRIFSRKICEKTRSSSRNYFETGATDPKNPVERTQNTRSGEKSECRGDISPQNYHKKI